MSAKLINEYIDGEKNVKVKEYSFDGDKVNYREYEDLTPVEEPEEDIELSTEDKLDALVMETKYQTMLLEFNNG